MRKVQAPKDKKWARFIQETIPQINQSLPLEVLLSVLLIPEPATSGKKKTYEAEVL